jgi:hypothetical protein
MAADHPVRPRRTGPVAVLGEFSAAPLRELTAISSQYVDTLASVQGEFIDARGVDVLPLTCRG